MAFLQEEVETPTAAMKNQQETVIEQGCCIEELTEKLVVVMKWM